MNAFEQQIKKTLMADRKCALENLEQLKSAGNYGLTVCEPPQYYYDWLERIDDTLERLENGDFNICRLCAGPIGEERLRSSPCADLCIECQKKLVVHRLIHKFNYAFSPR
jgi:RNA polymerase-binding transcription factor DksA